MLRRHIIESVAFALIAASVLVFGLMSGRLQQSIITPPIFFVAVGMLLGAGALNIFHLDAESEVIRILAEFTLVLVLFTDASRIDLKLLMREYGLALRLLAIGLPLTCAIGAMVAALLFDTLSLWEAAVLAAILAPTDAALGQAVVSSPRIPVRIRQTLNVESGLNDGVVLPAVLILLSLASSANAGESGVFWLKFVGLQLLLGPLVGATVGYLGGRLVDRALKAQWMNHTFERLSSLAIAISAFAFAELVGGNGFIAAFAAGLALGNSSRSICGPLYDFGEAEGQLLTLLIFLLFGGVMVWPALAGISWSVVLYVILSLTAVRMLPVAISLLGAKLQLDTTVFVGWFGPRGIASILFGLLALGQEGLGAGEQIFTIIVLTVLASVFLHGVSAYPGANWYAHRAETMREEADTPELEPITEMPVRIRYPQ